MKTIGLIGGTTWLSTIDYYRLINQSINERLGGLNSAKLYLYSLNFEEFKPGADERDWDRIARTLTEIGQKLETAGAECLAFCANTPHLVADIVQEKINIPLIHIAEATAKEINNKSISNVGLLGTSFTMERSFFKEKLFQRDIETLIPETEERALIHNSIFGELGQGIFSKETKSKYLDIIDKLKTKGAGGVIFGCTEIPLLLKQEDCDIPVFDTTEIHAKAIVDFALS